MAAKGGKNLGKISLTTIKRATGGGKKGEAPKLNEHETRYEEGLPLVAEELEMDVDELKTYLQEIQKEVEKAVDGDYDVPIIFRYPKTENEMYDSISQLNELVGFFKVYADAEEAKSVFVDSYLGHYRHVSRDNPALEDVFKKVDAFRTLEEITEGLENVGECLICGGKKIQIKVKGTRSADEALTVLYTCSNCRAAGRNIRLYKQEEVKAPK